MQTIRIELWTDEENGRCYLEEFLDSRQVIDAGQIVEILQEDFEGHYLGDLYRDEKLRIPQDDLIYLRFSHKDKKIRIFGCVRGRRIYLVHGVIKRGRDIRPEDVQLAVERIKRIPIE